MKKLTKKQAASFISGFRFTTAGRFFDYNACVQAGFSIAEADKIEGAFRMTDTNMSKSEVVAYVCEKYNA